MEELKPRDQWLQERFEAVCSAIAERYKKNLHIPLEWVKEYNGLLTVVENTEKNDG